MSGRPAWVVSGCTALWTTFGVFSAPAAVVFGTRAAQATESEGTRGHHSGAEMSSLLSSDLEDLLAVPVVELASKRLQSSYDAPVAVTVLREAEIEAHVALNVAELLRRVVGVYLMQVNANEFNVGLRGVNRLLNNRVLVLINGRRIDEPLQGYSKWDMLPIHAGDVERIEVLRGPSSTLYGADAFSGVVNIVTKSPLGAVGAEAVATSTMHYLPPAPGKAPERSRLQNGGQGYVAYSWRSVDETMGIRASLGLHRVPEWSEAHRGSFWRHGPHAARAMLSFAHRPNAMLQLDGGVSYVTAEAFGSSTTVSDRRPNYTTEAATWLRVHKRGISDLQNLEVKAHLDASYQTLWRGGQNDQGVVGIESARTLRLRGDFQCDVSSFQQRNVFTLGVESTYQASSELFGVAPSKRMVAAVAQDELVLSTSPVVLLSLGTRLEHYETSDRRGTTVRLRNISPRGALIWRPSQTQSVRLSGASAYRTATAFEGLVNVGFQLLPEPIPQNTFVASNPRVRPERVLSVELGYQAKPREDMKIDATLFAQRVTGLIDLSTARSELPTFFENKQSLETVGLEMAAKTSLSRSLTGYLNYTLQLSRDGDRGHIVRDVPSHLVGAGLHGPLRPWVKFSLGLYVASAAVPRFPGQVDTLLRVTKRRLPPQILVDVRVAAPLVELGEAEVFIAGQNLLGFVRRRGQLLQHPTPNNAASPIGATVLLGIVVGG